MTRWDWRRTWRNVRRGFPAGFLYSWTALLIVAAWNVFERSPGWLDDYAMLAVAFAWAACSARILATPNIKTPIAVALFTVLGRVALMQLGLDFGIMSLGLSGDAGLGAGLVSVGFVLLGTNGLVKPLSELERALTYWWSWSRKVGSSPRNDAAGSVSNSK